MRLYHVRDHDRGGRGRRPRRGGVLFRGRPDHRGLADDRGQRPSDRLLGRSRPRRGRGLRGQQPGRRLPSLRGARCARRHARLRQRLTLNRRRRPRSPARTTRPVRRRDRRTRPPRAASASGRRPFARRARIRRATASGPNSLLSTDAAPAPTKRSRRIRSRALLDVGRERWPPTRRRWTRQQVADHPHVAQRDRQALADDRVVPAGGVADERRRRRPRAQSSHESSLEYTARGLIGVASTIASASGSTAYAEGVEEAAGAALAGEAVPLASRSRGRAGPARLPAGRRGSAVSSVPMPWMSAGKPPASSTRRPLKRWCGGSLSRSTRAGAR